MGDSKHERNIPLASAGSAVIEGQQPVVPSGPQWTAEQLQAITERNCSLLVAAAAGAGKTAVLVERIIRKILDKENPLDIDHMLIVTFTNAAATEMRERISDAISKELDRDPGSENLRRQLSLLGKASITTIHSFCRDVIKNHIEQLGLDPDFRVADDTESTLMRLEAMTELFEDQYEQEQADFTELLECYGGNRNDQPIQDMVMSLYDFIQSSPWPDQWLEEKLAAMEVPAGTDFSVTPWGKVLMGSLHLELCGLKQMMDQALEHLKYAMGLEKYIPVFEDEAAQLENLISQALRGWDDLYEALQTIQFKRLPMAAKDADKEKQELVKDLRDAVKDTINKKLKIKLVNARSEQIYRDIEALTPVMQCLARLVREFTQRYDDKKKRKAIVDFNDLEHLCLEILTDHIDHKTVTDHTEVKIVPSRIALEYRARFDEIMVDEYQDSNLVQEILIQMISRHTPETPNVFMVGDVKQSIYRFRQARPELFLEKYNTYSTVSGDPFRKIMLYKNFRSRSGVLDAVNYIFKQIMSESVGELDYTEDEALYAGATFAPNLQPDVAVGGPVEFHLIQTGDQPVPDIHEETGEGDPEEPEAEEEQELPDNIQSEARLVARRIVQMMMPDEKGCSFQVFDKKKKVYRNVAYKDIVILLRATKNWSEVFVDELSAMGIPAFADTGTGFFKTVEIQVILSLLAIIDNPLQDIPLLSVLRSPICAFSTNELAEVRLAARKVMLFDALKLLAGRHPVSDGPDTLLSATKKAADFIDRLGRWRKMALHMSTDQLLWYLYQDTNYFAMVGALPAGEQRQANLRILYDRARQFEETSYKGLFNFIHFIDRLKSSRGDMGSAKILGENDNVVRIMSIHKSKGLEFPVVFISGCGKRFNLMDMNKSVLLHHQLGFGPDLVDYKRRVSRPSALKKAIREKIRVETLSEEMRILYVAMTRAREKLILTGAVRNVEQSVNKWLRIAATHEQKLPAHAMISGSGFLDWIGPALLRHIPKDGAEEEQNTLLSHAAGSEFTGKRTADSSQWEIRLWSKWDVLSSSLSEVREALEFPGWMGLQGDMSTPSEHFNEVKRRLEWAYSFGKVNKTPAKVTVTELKRRFEADLAEVTPLLVKVPALVKKPMFLEEEKGLSAAEKGTVLHFVMQHLDFENSDLQAQLETMVKRDLLTEQQAQTVSLEKIQRFLGSDLGGRMLSADKVFREVPFNMEIPCHEVFLDMVEEEYKEETLLLQGIIDCYFEQPDGLVLLDYKTDAIPPAGITEIAARYRLQLNYYAQALGKLTGKRVKERYLYLFSAEQVLEL
ncbi:MAG: helicase-exonuclease AddAB subunit AddA [Thermoclostridium sp.]|nr:helicase-exonuclease AddAB subunit AddA [Thermoclostridium sp.]